MTVVGPVDIERVFRAESGRAVASLIRLLGDIDMAEEAVQDAFDPGVLSDRRQDQVGGRRRRMRRAGCGRGRRRADANAHAFAELLGRSPCLLGEEPRELGSRQSISRHGRVTQIRSWPVSRAGG